MKVALAEPDQRIIRTILADMALAVRTGGSMRLIVVAACLTNLLLIAPVAARDTLMSTAELASFCSAGNLACEFYLQGAWDGIALVSKNTGTRLVCASQEPNAFQLKQYFTAAMLARSLAGKSYGAEPAIDMVYSAFTTAMPCK